MEIRIDHLKKKYGMQIALDIGHLNINKGELIGIVGNNGAGKTTLFRLLLDLIEATEGSVSIAGQNNARSDHWKDLTGSFLDDGFLIDFLTPEEFFYFTGRVYGLNPSEIDVRIEDYSRFMNQEILGQKKYIRQFSTGNKQKIGIMAAMIVKPQLLILDEPFNFLDPSSQILIKRMLQKENEHHGTTMLISSHNLSHIIGICNRIILLEQGIIIKDLRLPSDDMRDIEDYFSVNAG